MAFARDTYTADGSSQTYGITFPYISRSHVTATVDGTNRTFTWNHASSITLDSPTLSGGEAIVITRSSNRTARLVDYNDGATLTESDLDLDSKQALYMAQEAFDAQEVLDASNIADGSVSNTEFQYLDGVTSSIQTQIDAAVAGGGGSMNDVIDDTSPQLGGNLDVNGFTVDGRDPSVDGTKLDTIETSATADMSGAEIKAAYETEPNAFTDADHTKLDGIETGATADQTASEVVTAKVGSPTYDKVQQLHDLFHSSGSTSGGVISDNGGGNITVSAGTGFIRATDSDVAELPTFDWPALGSTAIPSNTTRYIGVEYNAGSPQVVVHTSYDWDFNTNFGLGNVVNDAGTLHIENSPHKVGDHASKMLQRLHETMNIRRDNLSGGLALGETGTRKVTMSAGGLWSRLDRFTISAIDTSASSTFLAFYRDGASGFTEVTGVTDWPNAQYDDGSGTLVTMTNNRYACLWFYVNLDGAMCMQYGRSEFTSLAAAEADTAPSTAPDLISLQSILIGRIIFQKSDTAAQAIESAFGTTFAGSGVSDHGSLSGLTDDDHTQYLLRTDTASTAEVTTGTNNTKMVTPAAINGSTLALDGATTTNTKTDTTGTVYGLHDQTTFSPAASSDAIIVANAGTMICSSTQATTGSGHSVGVLGTGLHNTTTTYPLLVGTEGLIQKTTSGTITEADGLLSHNLGNAGTLTKANGVRCAITGNTGTMTEYNAVQADIVSNSGTISAYNGVLVKDLEEGSGTIGDVVGFKFEDQTDTFGSKKAIEILDADAAIETAGNIIQNGTTSGSITVAAPAVAGSNTITYPADTGTVMLTKNARVLQVVDVTDTTGSSGTTIGWGLDNTIPQTSECDQYLSVAITPQSSTSTATDEITFKFRAAKLNAGTLYFNKLSTSSVFGGVMKSFIRVIEFQP